MTRPAVVEIDHSALKHNLNIVKEYAPYSKVIAMVKANAYGHGLVQVVKVLEEADAFGVASIDEAIVIRKAGVNMPIVLMAGFFLADELQLLETLNCTIVLHNQEQLNALMQVRLSTPISVWIKIDTGMHRLGFSKEMIPVVYQQLSQHQSVKQPLGFMTHFSDADDIENNKTHQQIALFNSATQGLIGDRSLANSAGILNYSEAHADWVRPGLMLYGVSPIRGKTGDDFNLKPVMTLRSKVMAVHHQRKGDKVGYCSEFTCPVDMPIGIAAIGYGDGYPFHIATKTPVLINQRLCHVVGRVAMDMIAIDLRAYSQAKIGDDVVLWGKGLPVEHIAHMVDSIPYELLCGIARRVHVKGL